MVQFENITLGDHIRCPIVSGNVFIPGAPRRVSSEETVTARTSRAINMTKHIMTGDGYSIILEGTSANHPGMNAAENVAALASCIRGAISDVDRKYPSSVKSCVATVELSKGELENRANAHGSLVIHGRVHLLRIADDFQLFLHQRGAMNRAMLETDGTRVVIHCGIDRFQRFYEWMLYCIKAKDQNRAVANATYGQRQSEVLQNAGIIVVGNHLDNLFILHEKRA